MTPQPAKAKKKRKRHTIPTYLTEDEIARLLRATKVNTRDRAIFAVAYYRGLRASELGLIRVDDYDPVNQRIVIHRLKGSRGGEYPVVHDERIALTNWLRERPDNTTQVLFPSRKGRPISRKTLHDLMRHYCEVARIDVRKAHFHALKHSTATHLSARDPDIVGVQDHLGHAAITSTMLYVSVSSKRRMDFSERAQRGGWGLSRH
jgi:site-specific recombinase XerD